MQERGNAYRKTFVSMVALVASVLIFPFVPSASAAPQDVNSSVRAKLDKSQYKDVRSGVDKNGIATLTGTVNLYEYKADAERVVHKVKGVTAVRNQIEVSGPSVPDEELKNQLAKRLAYDRVGYGNEFDAMTIGVQNGAVTLGGHVHDYMNRNSALALVSTTPGVKDLIDEIEVDPVSQMDWDLRIALVRAIYGYPTLNRYALDPAHPIRISVQNGNVSLYGVVDSQADKDAANIRANGVSGVFSVKNNLVVSGQPSEK